MTRVLIVDDREDSRYFLSTLLNSNGYAVETACHGAEALDKALQNPPQLVISDLLMPVMDGYTLLRQWKADTRLSPIPFIVYTATYTDSKDEQLALDLGANAFILKPAEPADLIPRILQVLTRAAAGAAAEGSVIATPAKSARIAVAAPQEEETKILRQYSEVLIHKLEDKMEESDKANRELQQDIAKRKQAEAQLRVSEQKYRELVEHANSIILRWTCDGRITFLNEFGQKFFGYTEPEVIGRGVVGTIVAETESTGRDLRPLMERIAADPKAFEQNVNQNMCRDGRRVWIAWTNKAVVDEQGAVKEVLSIGTDITERRQLEEQFRQAQKLEAIGQLAGGVAHDFNNILTVIQGNASFLLEGQNRSEEEADAAKQIVEAAERAARLTRQLLLFSRKQVMQPINLNLNETVGNMTKMLQRILREDVALRSDFAPNLPLIHADAGMIEQVLLNLAVNARDAMPDGGRLMITTSSETAGSECTQRNPEAAPGQHVCLTVSDTGCGITPENLPRIFDPFFTTKEVGKGTGLGLATVYGIVKQHRGWIDVTSQVGKGTAFRIYLPSAEGARGDRRPTPTATQLPGGSEVILVVEDDPAVRLLVSNLLQRCGYTVLQAVSGVAALEVWNEHKARIQLLLTDMVMPDGMMGRELAARLKGEEPQLKVIYTSGYSAEVVDKGAVLQDGFNFLQKPYAPLKLAQTVRNLLDGVGPGAAASS